MTHYIIIENEEYALINLKQMIGQLRPDYELVFTAESVEESVAFFQTNPKIDLIFMDIELTDGNCFEIFRQVDINVPVIFTTAYNDYAIQAFKVTSIDYLLKPIAEQDLSLALAKYERLKSPRMPDYQQLLSTLGIRKSSTQRERILITIGDNYSYVNTADIDFFMRDEKYVYVVLNNGKRHITEFQNLSEVEAGLDATRFFQLSRNIIVCITAITKVSKWFTGRLKVSVGKGEYAQSVVVSAARRSSFLEWLGGGSPS